MANKPTIKSFYADSGTIGDGITDANVITLSGTADANATVNVYDGSTLLGSAKTNGSGVWLFETPKLSDSAHSLTATATDASGTSAASAAMAVTVVPSVTDFRPASDNWQNPIKIDGQGWFIESPNKAWSVTNPDPHTVRMEVRPGDEWADDGTARSEILTVTNAEDHQVFNASYTMTIEPGQINNVAWLSLTQMHEDSGIPFSIQLVNDHMTVLTDQNADFGTLAYSDPNAIVRGHAYDIQIRANFSTDSTGFLQIWRDGVQIVDYHGQLGSETGGQYLKLGIYEGWPENVSSPTAVDYSNIVTSYNNPNVATPSAPGNTAPPPTAPSAPTAPAAPPAAPAIVAPSGNSTFDGSAGNDKISFNFKLTDATVSFSGNHVIVDGPGGSHTVLTGFNTYVFTDGTVNEKDGDPLVDDLFYYSHNHDVWNAHVDADQHYHQYGWHEGRDPDAFFSTSFYLSLNQDVKQAGVDPLVHFYQFGWQEGRQPSAAFDDAAYLAANPDVAAAHIDPLAHFLQFGEAEGRQPTTLTSLIGPHGFDYVYYLQHNPDVQAAEVDPFQHYENFGWKEGRDPNALFDTNGYLAANPDVAKAHINPLDHYDQSGWKEGRDPSPAFDTSDYLSHYRDVAAAGIDPLVQYLQYGIHEGRQSFGHAISGSTGNEVLKSTPNNDLFVGNGGQDTFVFAANFGHDVIKDFAASGGTTHDVVQFSKTVFDSFASVLSHATQFDSDVLISAGSDTLLLKNTKLGALDSSDFRFT